MLVLRMLSGLLVKVCGFLRREPDGPVTDPQELVAMGPLAKVHEVRLWHGAEVHADAAREAVKAFEGESALRHMNRFRRCSSGIIGPRPDPPAGMIRCSECGSTCTPTDMQHWPEYCRSLPSPVCAACVQGFLDENSWTTASGRRISVYNMTNDHLVNSASMVRRRLLDGIPSVSDDRIRMCGHVLEECDKRGIRMSWLTSL